MPRAYEDKGGLLRLTDNDKKGPTELKNEVFRVLNSTKHELKRLKKAFF